MVAARQAHERQHEMAAVVTAVVQVVEAVDVKVVSGVVVKAAADAKETTTLMVARLSPH